MALPVRSSVMAPNCTSHIDVSANGHTSTPPTKLVTPPTPTNKRGDKPAAGADPQKVWRIQLTYCYPFVPETFERGVPTRGGEQLPQILHTHGETATNQRVFLTEIFLEITEKLCIIFL
jgi:hypothetical protein